MVRRSLSLSRAAWLAVAFLLFASGRAAPVRAQGATGDIQGRVVEQLGGPLAAVAVTATNVRTGTTRRTRSNAEGLFTLPALPAGEYEITARRDGFAAQRQERLHVGVGVTTSAHLELRRAPLEGTLTLAAPPRVTEPLRTGGSSSIARDEIEALPLPTRNALDLSRLSPFVLVQPAAGTIRGGGLPESMNRLLVDGVDAERSVGSGGEAGAASGTIAFLGRETVYAIHVGSSAASAEYGRAGGALVGVATPSGSNVLTGGLFERYRGSALRNTPVESAAAGRPEPPFGANQFGGTAGGPLARGRHFFMAAYDGLREHDEHPVFPRVPHPASLSPAATAVFAQLQATASNRAVRRDQDLVLARTDHRVGDAHRLGIRYLHQDFGGLGIDNAEPRLSDERTGPATRRARSFIVGAGLALTDAAFNDLRMLAAHHRHGRRSNSSRPQADIHERGALVIGIGGDALGRPDTTLDRIQVANTLTFISGRHTIGSGFDAKRDIVRAAVADHAHGAYVFQSLAGFGSGSPDAPGESYTQSVFASGGQAAATRPDSGDYAFFVQDKWRVTSTLTVDAGLRYDRQVLAKPPVLYSDPGLLSRGIAAGTADPDTNNWGPRLGVAWAPAPALVARAAYDITYGRTGTGIAAAAHAYNGTDVRTFTLHGGAGDPVPAYPARLAAPPPGARPAIVAFGRGFENPRVQQASAGVEWEWMPHSAISLTYQHVRADALPVATDVNVGAPVPVMLTLDDSSVETGPGGVRTVPSVRYSPGPLDGFGRVILLHSTGESHYNGLAIAMTRRLAQGYQYRLAYAFGKAVETLPIVTTVAPGTSLDRQFARPVPDPRPGFSTAAFDQRQRLLGSVVFRSDNVADRFSGLVKRILEDWQLGAVYTLETGYPYSAYVNADLDGDGNRFNDLAPGTNRHQFRQMRQGRIDARLARDVSLRGGVRLTASLDVFNALNAAHYRDIDETMYAPAGTTLLRNPDFGERSYGGDPRTVQLGIAVTF